MALLHRLYKVDRDMTYGNNRLVRRSNVVNQPFPFTKLAEHPAISACPTIEWGMGQLKGRGIGLGEIPDWMSVSELFSSHRGE